MSTQPKPILLTDDNGYADHKMSSYDPAEMIIHNSKTPSIIGSGHGLNTATGDLVGGYTVLGEYDQQYTCDNNITNPIDTRHAAYPVSIENRVLLTHALNNAGLLGKEVALTVTLPFADYYLPGGEINMELVEKVKANFMQNNVRADGGDGKGQTAKVVDCRVSPEAVSAWFDWALDEQGNVNDNYADMLDDGGAVLVVDVGGSTTDIVSLTLSPQLTVLNERSGTEKAGVLDVMEQMETEFLRQMRDAGVIEGGGHESVLSPNQKSALLSGKTIRFARQTYSIEDLYKKVTENVARRIEAFIRKTAGNTHSFHSIIVVGGGAIVFKEALGKLLSGAVFLDEYANSRGALKLAIQIEREG